MSGGQSVALDVSPGLARPEPVDPAEDLAGFQRMLAQEIRDDWRPEEGDSEAWVFTGVPGHLGTLVNQCRFPGCHGPSFTRRSGLCNVCAGRYIRHTKRLGAMTAETWIEGAVQLPTPTGHSASSRSCVRWLTAPTAARDLVCP